MRVRSEDYNWDVHVRKLVLQPGVVRITSQWMRISRGLKWEIQLDWQEEDLERRLDSREVLEEVLQDYTKQKAIVRTHVVSLYPSLNVEKVYAKMREVIKKSGIKWEGIDYLGGTWIPCRKLD